ncbi:MAG: hypothetical protein ABIP03_15580 [Aquihabitans sp.]
MAAVFALLAACGTNGDKGPKAVPSTSEATPLLKPSVDASATDSLTTDAPTATPPEDDLTHIAPEFPEDTAPQFRQVQSQRDLVFTDVRVGEHETFDRIVLEFSGTGPLGWSVNYVDEAVLEGSGDVVPVGGDTVLVIFAHYNLWPASDYYSGPKQFKPQSGGDIKDVFIGGTFEGYTQVFAGIDGDPVPFRVFALTNPSRLVVDVEKPSMS